MELDGAYQSIKFNAALVDSKNDCDAVTVVIQDRVTDEVYKRVTIKAGQDNAIEAEINASEELDIFIDDPLMDEYADKVAYFNSPESRTLVIGNMMLAE